MGRGDLSRPYPFILEQEEKWNIILMGQQDFRQTPIRN